MRKILLALIAVGAFAAVGVALLIDRSGPCDALAERDFLDSMSDFDESGAERTMEDAVEAAFAEAGMPNQADATNLDPIIRGDGNLVHVGVDGYGVVLATVQDGDGFVSVERPRPCSVLDRSA